MAAACICIAGAKANPTGTSGFTTGSFALEIDGNVVGFLKGVGAASLTVDTPATKLTSDNILNETTGTIPYSEVSVQCGVGMSSALYDWIKAECGGNYPTHRGGIIVTDSNLKPIQELKFSNAVISEVTFPSVLSRDNTATSMVIHISASNMSLAAITSGPLTPPARHQPWEQGDYKLTIQGVDCTQVSRIDSLTIQFKVVDSANGA